MDKMMEQINQILSDPDSVKQIMDIASAFGIHEAEGALPDLSMASNITQALGQVQEKEEKQQALVRALLPYLRPKHRTRLERAIQVARISHLAGAALKADQPAAGEELKHDV